jgi:hypothetical protein
MTNSLAERFFDIDLCVAAAGPPSTAVDMAPENWRTGSQNVQPLGEFVGKELQGDVATELEILPFVHDAHAPATDLADDSVMGNRLTNGLGRCGHLRKS